MLRVSITAPGEFTLEDVPPPVADPGQLVLAPLRVGICATDMELLDGTMVYLRNGTATWPFTPGHEWVAVVAETNDPSFNVGDLVVGECTNGCWQCPVCASGNYHQCPNRQETGLFGQGGALSELFTFPSRSAHKVPPSVRLEDIALVEPTAIAYKGLQRLELLAGARVLVIGGGTIGYLAGAVAQTEFGAEVVYWASRP
ncbi:MAG: alcohol dehydrogenase catalytic domain-containing protein, partial [Bifidobacteriaceae bacterium]|nr:alcohol dehydrogenase catalytic domain-containing protein [Bifidobacteriaceae bacterium]